MKLVIPGGSGQVGGILARAFHQRGDEVVVLSRRTARRACPPVPGCRLHWQQAAGGTAASGTPFPRIVEWDAETLGPWMRELDGADVVINLAGRSVNCRYTARNRRMILNSRVQSTRVLGRAMARAERPPRVWLQAGTATIYAHRYDAPNDEATGIIGGNEPDAPAAWRFSIEVAEAWERAASEVATPRTRQVVMRSAMTMSPDPGGIFAVLLRLVRFGLGGRVGDGRQYVSWIHDQDFVRAVLWLIEHDEIQGVVNLAAPNPLPYAEFMSALRRAWGIRGGLPATKWMVELGTFLLRTEPELVLKSRRVVPGRLLQSGFGFGFPSWAEAARDLCARWRTAL